MSNFDDLFSDSMFEDQASDQLGSPLSSPAPSVVPLSQLGNTIRRQQADSYAQEATIIVPHLGPTVADVTFLADALVTVLYSQLIARLTDSGCEGLLPHLFLSSDRLPLRAPVSSPHFRLVLTFLHSDLVAAILGLYVAPVQFLAKTLSITVDPTRFMTEVYQFAFLVLSDIVSSLVDGTIRPDSITLYPPVAALLASRVTSPILTDGVQVFVTAIHNTLCNLYFAVMKLLGSYTTDFTSWAAVHDAFATLLQDRLPAYATTVYAFYRVRDEV